MEPPIPHFPPQKKHLSGRAPDRLEEAVLLCEPVEAVVRLAHGADKARDGVDLVVARVAAVLVNLADAYLHGCVVFGGDDAVCCAAFAGDVAVQYCVS